MLSQTIFINLKQNCVSGTALFLFTLKILIDTVVWMTLFKWIVAPDTILVVFNIFFATAYFIFSIYNPKFNYYLTNKIDNKKLFIDFFLPAVSAALSVLLISYLVRVF